MAGLKSLRLPEAKIETAGGDFTVRGISMSDLAMLMRHHGPAIGALFDEIRSGKAESIQGAILSFGESAVGSAPELVADVIALASGETDAEARKIVRGLPFPVQIEAIKQIAALTFESDDAVGKLAETVVHMAQGVGRAVTELQKPMGNGSAVSATQ